MPPIMTHPMIGIFTLDLTNLMKGKVLEPVRVRFAGDRETVIVDQYTRKLAPTCIPVGGGTRRFDQRFGTAAKCGPLPGAGMEADRVRMVSKSLRYARKGPYNCISR